MKSFETVAKAKNDASEIYEYIGGVNAAIYGDAIHTSEHVEIYINELLDVAAFVKEFEIWILLTILTQRQERLWQILFVAKERLPINIKTLCKIFYL